MTELITSGISLKKLCKRVCIIHYRGEYVKYSPFDNVILSRTVNLQCCFHFCS